MTRSAADRRERELLLGEWACLGILYGAPVHGFAVAASLKPNGDVGRVWSLSRALTYRSLDQLAARGLVHAVGEERGIAGGTRTILAATRSGRSQLREWLATPVEHLRDLRSELLLKLVIADRWGIDVTPMIQRQRAHVAALAAALADQTGADDADVSLHRVDVVTLWRSETSQAALRFLDRLQA